MNFNKELLDLNILDKNNKYLFSFSLYNIIGLSYLLTQKKLLKFENFLIFIYLIYSILLFIFIINKNYISIERLHFGLPYILLLSVVIKTRIFNMYFFILLNLIVLTWIKERKCIFYTTKTKMNLVKEVAISFTIFYLFTLYKIIYY